jgi:Arc/MetJ-type ribon-helix-helix transcriptional regulator
MQIELSPEQASFVDLGIQQGRFRDPEEAMQQALALWVKRERVRLELLADIDAAERSLDAGEGSTYAAGSIHELAEAVERRGRARLAGR